MDDIQRKRKVDTYFTTGTPTGPYKATYEDSLKEIRNPFALDKTKGAPGFPRTR